MTIQSSGAISMDDIRSEYHLVGNSIDIDRIADIAGVANNIGAFYGKSYLNKFGDSNPTMSGTSAGTLTNASGANIATVRICIGINGSDSASPSVGWIWSKCNGIRGGNIYIYNNNLEITVGRNDYTTTTLRYAIPSDWTNDVIREIVWGYNRRINQYLRVDGVVEVNMANDSALAYLNEIAIAGTAGLHQFLVLPDSNNIGVNIPSGAHVAPSNIVAKRCDVWRNLYYA
tara:strand:+ start:118 stop:807 length:690 start_codon:yes stop_codon:yes gene_type:complete